jgi:hypothetical protein
MTDGTEPTLAIATPQPSSERPSRGVMAALAAGYVGIYLCRKNLAVAVPMLQQSFGATKAREPRSGGSSTSAGIRWASPSSPASPACRP